MSEKPSLHHTFTLNIGRAEGSASIFIHHFLPVQIRKLEPSDTAGTNLTTICADGSEITIPVTQSVAAIKAIMAECRRLDEELGESHG